MSYQFGNAELGVVFTGDLGSLQRTLDQAGGSVDQFGRRSTGALRGVASEAGRADDAMSRLANGIKGAFIGGSVAVGLIGLKNMVVEATKAVIDAQVQIDRWRNGFAFGAGSMVKGVEEFAFVREEVNRLGLDLGSTAAQYMKMVAASRGSSLAGAQTREVFKSIAEASVVMGMNADQNERAFMAVTQMMSKGKVMAEELRGQLGEHLPGAFSIAARAMGVTEVELNKLMESGQVFSADFLPKFAAQLRKELAGSVEGSSLSMQANLNRLETAWLNFKQQFAQSGSGGFLSDQIQVLAGDLKVLGDVMEASRQNGEGFWMTLANTAGAATGRATFGALSSVFNGFNWTVNALTGNVFGLNENLNLLPDNLRSTAEQFTLTGQKIRLAEQEYATLSARLAQAPDNIYIKSELGNLARYIARLKEAQDEQRLLMGSGAADPGNESGAEAARLARQNAAAGEAIARRAAQQSARDALLKRYASPAEKLTEELRTQKELLGDLFTPEIEARIRANFIKPAQVGGGAVRTVADEFERLSERLGTDLAAGAAQAQASQQGLNTAQTDFLKLAASPVWDKLTGDQRARVAALFEQRIAQEQLADGLKATAAAAEAAARAEDERLKTYTDAAGKADTRLKDLRAEVQAMDYAEKHHVTLAEAVEQTALARLREAQAAELAKGTGMNDSVVLALQQEIDARRQLIDALASKQVREAANKLREDEAADWKRTWEQVGQSFTDALMEGGRSVKDYLVSLFRTLVLRPVLAPAITPLAAAISGPAAAGTGAASPTGLLGSVAQLAGLSGALGTGIAAGFANALTGTFAGSLSAAGSLIGTGTAAGVSAGVGMGIGTIAPYALAAFAAYKLLTAETPGEQHSGGYYSSLGYTGLEGAARITGAGPDSGQSRDLIDRADAGITSQVRTSVDELLAGVSGMAQTLGQNIALGLDLGFAANTNGQAGNQNAFGYFGVSANGQLVRTSQNRDMGTDAAAAYQQLTTDAANALADVVLGNTGLVRAGESSLQTLQRLSSSLQGVNAIFDTLGASAYQVSLAGGDMASQLADLFGGIEAFGNSAAAYYQAFYGDAERSATTTRQLTAALGNLGLQLPESREAFRALVEAQDLTTEAGRRTYAALLGLAPSFASITDSAADLAGALQQAGDAMVSEIERLRGLAEGGVTVQGYAALQARFATATAQARAGDVTALQALPSISKALEEAATIQASTASELSLIRQQLAASLQATLGGLGLQVPSLDVGTNYVPHDMLIMAHRGEAVVPAAYNPAGQGGALGNEAALAELRALREQLALMRAESDAGFGAVAEHTAKTARILDRVTPDGNAMLIMTQAEFDAL